MSQVSGRVLLLNATYEVLGTVGMARAIRLMLRDENPIVVEEVIEGETIRSAKGEVYDKPSVIRLKHYVNIRKRRAQAGAKRLRIYIRDKFRCQYCGEKFDAKSLTLDHVHPKSRGGNGDSTNLVTACKPCNLRKADRTPNEARMPLLTPVKEYNVGLDKILLCHYAESRPEWKPYLFLEETTEDGVKVAV